MKQSLFDDGPSSGTAGETFGINSDYAKRFEVWHHLAASVYLCL